MTPAYLKDLTDAVQAMHGCPASHEGTAFVHEQYEGKTVWQGKVETFTLTGHPRAQKAYAWGYNGDEGEMQFIAVLHVPPIVSPRHAVQAAIASRKQK